MAAIQARGKLIVGTRFDLTGFGVRDPTTGTMEGFDVEVAKLIAVGIFGGTPANAVGKIEFMDSVTGNREASIKDGQDGQVDFAIAAYRITDAAKQQVDFAGPYFVAGQTSWLGAARPPSRASPILLAGRSAAPAPPGQPCILGRRVRSCDGSGRPARSSGER